MRVLPFGSFTAANESRPRFSWKIGVQLPAEPPVVERSRPPAALPASVAYTVFGLLGSNLTSLIEPACVSAKLAPPSVEAYTPTAGDNAATVLVLVAFEPSPRVPERVPMRMWFALVGSIAIHAMERLFETANEPGTSAQCAPSSVVL